MAQHAILYTENDIHRHFGSTYLARGRNYFCSGKVRESAIAHDPTKPNQQLISGKVCGNGHKSYEVRVKVSVKTTHLQKTIVEFDDCCSCPMSYDCKHVVALLLQVAAKYPYQSSIEMLNPYVTLCEQAKTQIQRTTDATAFTQWFDRFNLMQSKVESPSSEFIVYLLNVTHCLTNSELVIKPMLSRFLKKGGYGVTKRYTKTSDVSAQATTDEDRRLIALLEASAETDTNYNGEIRISLKNIADVLIDVLQTKRAFWQKVAKIPLTLGGEKTLTTNWQIEDNGCQKLSYDVQDLSRSQVTLLPIQPLWYYDANNNACGPLKTDMPADILLSLLTLAPIEPSAVETVQRQLRKLSPAAKSLPLPKTIRKGNQITSVKKQASLRLFAQQARKQSYYVYAFEDEKVMLPLAELQFYYDNHMVALNEPDTTIIRYQQNKLIEIKRDSRWEQSVVDKLINLGIFPLVFNSDYVIHDNLKFNFLVSEHQSDDEILLTKLSSINQLAAANQWKVDIDDSFPVKLIDEIDEWYTDLDEGSDIDWFSLTLGIIVNGEKVNLLPLLVDVIQHRFRQLDSKAIAALPDDTLCPLKSPDGHYISVPFVRVRDILLVLCELFESKPLDENGALRLSQLQAGLLLEIEKAMSAVQLRWFGGERLHTFAKKLANFDGIKTVTPAKTLKATLRPYQQQGLNWLQFLREYTLGGILADDMGLGKTVQTLAHFGVEKAAKRLRKPSLLVVPTSLVNNWAMEAERFSPNLSVLILHGAERKKQFTNIEKFDIIITTYPLVIRDKEILLAQDYYYLILDEAQAIKNAKAKVTQILLQLTAQHRLCLTGTPMENHLGELWSLFHFVLPGLLGNSKRFKEIFRTPIERHGDDMRHAQLITRIKPFLLRRRKDDVIKELPKKTEIIRHIDIEGTQRDLYESVRLSMEREVRDAINEKGLGRSQIIILDALLKLRQICCAPSLLKLKKIKKTATSAKLDDLMSFLPDLLEEGRQVLLFSSFTSMLALIESELNKQSISYVKLTGQTRDRKTPIARFQNGESPLFLISLKAGGVGLNLTAADTVIHYDPWWNPAAEQQATDRAHRIGQTKPIFVYKLITKGTVEEKILEMQSKKRELIAGIIEHKQRSKMQLTDDDLNALFQPIG